MAYGAKIENHSKSTILKDCRKRISLKAETRKRN